MAQAEIIVKGARIMEAYNWSFPASPSTVEFDAAMLGFTMFHEGVKLSGPDDDLAAVIGSLGADWSNILSYLASMCELQACSTYLHAVIECVHRLWKIELGFRDVLEECMRQALAGADPLGLPWLCDDEWRNAYSAEARALLRIEAASTTLVRNFAPQPFACGGFFRLCGEMLPLWYAVGLCFSA